MGPWISSWPSPSLCIRLFLPRPALPPLVHSARYCCVLFRIGNGDVIDSAASITSPFPILFGGGSFGTLFVGSNGNVNFSGAFANYSNASIPTAQIVTLVAPWWDDFFPLPGTNQNVFWAVTGTAPDRELVIEWRDVRHFDCRSSTTATVKFQVVFFEGSSNVLFNYADATFGGA